MPVIKTVPESQIVEALIEQALELAEQMGQAVSEVGADVAGADVAGGAAGGGDAGGGASR
jgi:hypothetical protein